MSNREVVNGVYPVMLTPFTKEGNVDYDALIKLVTWYEESGADGLFAICQSSELFFLSLEEKLSITRTILKHTTLPVVASGNSQDTLKKQLYEMGEMAKTGVDAVVLLTNMFAKESENDEIFIKNLQAFIDNFKFDVPLGLYECPYPYKRLISNKVLKYIISTNRFVFLKDTSCDIDIIKQRLDIIKGSDFKLYNANDETLIESLHYGANGYSGIHANYSTKLLKDIYLNYNKDEKETKKAFELVVEINTNAKENLYPISAKQLLVIRNIFKSMYTRVKDYKLYNKENEITGKKLYKKIIKYEARQ